MTTLRVGSLVPGAVWTAVTWCMLSGAAALAGDPVSALEYKTAAPVRPLKQAVFTRQLGKFREPLDPTTEFRPGETICLSLQFHGRIKTGTVAFKAYYRDELLAEATVDLSKGGAILPIGDTCTFLKVAQEQPFPISARYRVEVTLDDKPLGAFPFKIVPPADAIPSKLLKAALAKGRDAHFGPVEPGTTFVTTQKVYLVVRADLGTRSALQVNWFSGDQCIEAARRTMTAKENSADIGFAFSCMPDGGWKQGPQRAVLTIDDREVGRYEFTIAK